MTDYLKKGHEVRYRPLSRLDEEFADQLRRDGLLEGLAHLPDGRIEIKGFVVGDTEADGLSVVALDNPDICLMTRCADDPTLTGTREAIRTGLYDSDIERAGERTRLFWSGMSVQIRR